jgi:hypothetical protein
LGGGLCGGGPDFFFGDGLGLVFDWLGLVFAWLGLVFDWLGLVFGWLGLVFDGLVSLGAVGGGVLGQVSLMLATLGGSFRVFAEIPGGRWK